MDDRKKTLIVGLDAACWDYLNPLLEIGRLPTLERLMASGISGTLHSTLPAHTPTAWASIITGKNPGKHGVFDMMWRYPGQYDFIPVNARMRIGMPFWDRLNEHGIRVGLINVPFTHPPDPVNGFVVGGFGTPSSVPDITYPHDVLDWVEERFGRYEPAVDTNLFESATPAEILDVERKHQANQVGIATALAEEHQVEILIINLMLPDHANHYIPDMDRVEQAICETDFDLNSLIHAFQPDNIMVISDHGSRRVKGNFLLYPWLRDHGYCIQVERTPFEQSATLNWILMQWLQVHWGWSGLPERILRRLAREIILRLPDRVACHFWNIVERDIPFARENVLFSDRTDYTRTQVFPGNRYSGLLYFNLAGRESTGVVSPQHRSALSTELVARLAEIMDPNTGQPLFSGVYAPEELYTGRAVEYAPDLILDSNDACWNVMDTIYDSRLERMHSRYFIDNRREFGWHSRDGIFVFSGKDFNIGPTSCNGHVLDVPATLLYLHDVPIPEDYDGRVLTEVISSEFISSHPVCYQPGDDSSATPIENLHSYSLQETEELLGRLRALGYVD